MAKRCSKYSGRKEKNYVLSAGPDGWSSGNSQSTWKEVVKTWVVEIQMLNKRQEFFQDAIEGRLSVQDRASERMQDRIIEEKKIWYTERQKKPCK